MNKLPSVLPRLANLTTRRQALKGLGLGALGFASLDLLPTPAKAANPGPLNTSDISILRYLLNLEYLEAQYFTYATSGSNIQSQGVSVSGSGHSGGVLIKSGAEVPFGTFTIQQYALEIAADERSHVEYLRSVLGLFTVAQPTLDLELNFNTLAQAAGIIKAGETFDPFADDVSFLVGAFFLEDVAVTAYRGMIPLVTDKTVLSALAGFLGSEASHAATIRTAIFEAGADAQTEAQDISDLRDKLDGVGDDDQGVIIDGSANIDSTNSVGMTFSRGMRQVLNILYLKTNASSGGFFPNGINS